MEDSAPPPSAHEPVSRTRLSYKFQRLREQLRSAVLRGEFRGRLPGERELGRRYRVNAKTVNKALCDLTREGLLVRWIGRGTFVAEGNGRPALVPSRTFQAFIRPVAGGSAGDRLLTLVEGEVAQQGHRLQLNRIGDSAEAVALDAWPSATRAQTSALLACPEEPLTSLRGQPDLDFIEEAMRRQVPIVMLGGGSEWAKLPSVTPDYGDAGYRAAEHFARLGCGEIAVVTSAARTREAELVLSGLRSGGQRQGVETTDLTLGSPEGLVELMARWSRGTARRTKDASADRVGVLVVGGAAAEWLTSHPTWPAARAARADAACILEPGDARAASWGLSAYEVDVQRMAQLAARLLADLRAGQVPTEWIVPGRWVVRGAGTREHRGHDEPGERQRLASQASDYCESVS